MKLLNILKTVLYKNTPLVSIDSSEADIHLNQSNMLNIIEDKFGHGNSYISKESKLNHKKPVPWFTYPAIEFLESLDISKLKVFEYGSGIGTRYWQLESKKVVSVESSKEWFKKNIKTKSKILYKPEKMEYIDSICTERDIFDIVVVDGEYRYECAKAAIKKISKKGIIILDNSEWYPKTSKLLRDKGYKQIDFSGFGPVVYFTWKTSFFFKSLELLEYKKLNYLPIGSYKHTVNPE